jgi:hypothetical protein
VLGDATNIQCFDMQIADMGIAIPAHPMVASVIGIWQFNQPGEMVLIPCGCSTCVLTRGLCRDVGRHFEMLENSGSYDLTGCGDRFCAELQYDFCIRLCVHGELHQCMLLEEIHAEIGKMLLRMIQPLRLALESIPRGEQSETRGKFYIDHIQTSVDSLAAALKSLLRLGAP